MKANKKCELEKLCKFILWYVAGSDGVRRITKTLMANKGTSYFPNMMTLTHVTYVVWTIENHLDKWRQILWIENLKDDDKLKAKSYKTLPPGEREKYAPKKTRYTSGEGAKRQYGKSLVSDKGKRRYEEIKKHWKVAWEDKRIRTKLTEERKKVAAKNKMCSGYERSEDTGGEEAGEAEGEEEGEGDLAPEIALHGDSYDDVMTVVPV